MVPLARVLVVDDDIDVAEVLRDFFTDESYEVRMAHDGRAGLDLFDAWRPHVVLLDLRMPHMGGAEVFQRIRAMQPTASVIFVTGADDETQARDLLRDGATDYVRKPIDLDYCALAVLLSVARSTALPGAHTPDGVVQGLYRLRRAVRSVEVMSSRLREQLDELGYAALRDALAQVPERAHAQVEMFRRCLEGAPPSALAPSDRDAIAAALSAL